MSDTLLKALLPELDHTDARQVCNLDEDPLYQIYCSAKKEFCKKKIMKVLNMEYELDRISSMRKLRSYELSLKAQQREAVKPSRCMFITVNPKGDVDLATFLIQLHKYCSRSMFSRTLYCVEQRGTIENNDLGKGFHAHILCCRSNGYPPNKIKKHTYNSFKHLVGSEAAIDYGGRYCVVANRESYITGTKKDPSKHPKQKGDAVWREKHGIEPYYGKLFSK